MWVTPPQVRILHLPPSPIYYNINVDKNKKLCSKCGFKKSLESFSKKGDGLQPLCKECQRDYHKQYYILNKQKYYEKNKRNRHKILDYIRQIKESNPCVDCGLYYPFYIMDFDHITDNKEFNIADGYVATSLVRIKKEIAKCELVCANCHRARTYTRLNNGLSSNEEDVTL